MTWTTEKPTRTGWYWYRPTPDAEPYPVKIFDANLLYVWPINDKVTEKENVTLRLADCSGEWAGPLVRELVMEPEEEKVASERLEVRKKYVEDILEEVLTPKTNDRELIELLVQALETSETRLKFINGRFYPHNYDALANPDLHEEAHKIRHRA